MQALVVDFRIKPAFVRDFEAAIEANARASRETEPGCRQFDVCRDPADPSLFCLYELYDDEAAVQTHLKSTHFLQMDAATASWIDAKVVRKLRRTHP
jgi:(4S)-4-hydroxy-5-phosphonooxypentane-2,3-dione isomerase